MTHAADERSGDRDAALLRAAREARGRAHAPYSNFRVGVALRTRSGRIYPGCNVESATFGLTLCAERVALFAAMGDGEREFDAMAIAVTDGHRALPCGICRQMLSEFAPSLRLILSNGDGTHRVVTVESLLPRGSSVIDSSPDRAGGDQDRDR